MRIGFECTAAVPGRSGIGRYAEQLGAALAEVLGEGDEIVALTNSRPPEPLTAAPPSWPTRPRALWLHFRAERAARRLGVDLCHFTSDLAPFGISMPYVLTVHDASIVSMPETHPIRRRAYYGANLARSVRRARRIVTVSRASATDIVDLLGADPERVDVIPLAADARFRPVLDVSEIGAMRRRYGLDGPYLLYVGTVQPRKNLMRLLEAFATIGRPDVTLVIAGALGWLTRETTTLVGDLGLASRVRFLGFVPEEDLPALYSAAEVFAYPSLLEGFGLPVLEAMACGAPVVAARAGSIPEVAGDAALLVDPLSVDDIARALDRIFGDRAERERLSRLGVERARSFSWTETARRTVEVYRLALEDVARVK